jgi:hypothetical protein
MGVFLTVLIPKQSEAPHVVLHFLPCSKRYTYTCNRQLASLCAFKTKCHNCAAKAMLHIAWDPLLMSAACPS